MTQVRLPREIVHLLRVSHLRFGREEAFRRSCRALLRDDELSSERDGAVRADAKGAEAPARKTALRRLAHPCLTVGDSVTLEMRLPAAAASNGWDKHDWTFFGEVCNQWLSRMAAGCWPMAAGCCLLIVVCNCR